MELIRAPTEADTLPIFVMALSICCNAPPIWLDICADFNVVELSVVIRLESVLKALALPAFATVNESPAAGVPVIGTWMPLKAIESPSAKAVPVLTTAPALLVTEYAVGLVNEMVYVSGTHA